MKVLYDIEDILKEELKKISKKGDITMTDLENIYKMVDILKDSATIEAMHRAEQEGYSRGRSMDYASEMYPMRWDGSHDGHYSEDGSYRRGRDAMGRYTSRDGGYSGHTKEQMVNSIKMMMRDAGSEQEKSNLRRLLDQFEE